MTDLPQLAEQVAEILRKEPSLLRTDSSPLLVVGDTHGDVDSTKKALDYADEKDAVAVFLGDYVDRGPYQIENITLLFERKLAEPNRLLLLRGNHETLTMNTYYGFLDTVTRRHGLKTYQQFLKAFAQLPYALRWRDVFFVHGGIARGLHMVEEVEKLERGEDDPEHPVAFQLLWNDPHPGVKGFAESDRGGGALYFGEDVFTSFMEQNGLRLLIRSHQPMPDGYRYIFGGRLLTVFSCRYYMVPPKAVLLQTYKEQAEIIELK
ncbi:MAG: metallophosphoesterase [Candidatus Caldarchaeum sp.]|nr:metallophosphoesterase [Candidatus Caldarchaeales archaeon]